jgi:hypothetical protein
VPSIGFVGTIIGISNALGIAHKIVTQQEQQEVVIQQITTQLAIAFDTTLVALLLSIPLMLAIHALSRHEEKNIDIHKSRMFTDHLELLIDDTKENIPPKEWDAAVAQHVDHLVSQVVGKIVDWRKSSSKSELEALDKLTENN